MIPDSSARTTATRCGSLAGSVTVRIDGVEQPMRPAPGGWFELPGVPAVPGARYAFRLDGGEPWLPDPRALSQPDGVHGESEVVDPRGLREPSTWQGRSLRGGVIYRAAYWHLHPGAARTRRHFRLGDRPPRRARGARRGRARADADRDLPRAPRLGVRRGRAVRHPRRLRRPGGPGSLRRGGARARPRRPGRRGPQPPRPFRQLPREVRPVLHRSAPHPVGRGGEPRPTRLPRGARLPARQRTAVVGRCRPGRSAARRRP